MTMNDQVQSNHVWCNGLRIHYEDHGAGAPVVLLHGGLVTGHLMWSNHVPALARNHRVLVPDSRGHGRTDNPEGRLAYDLMADDCAAFIEALGLDRPAVVGYSDGAQTALELGIRHPDRIAGLVLGGVVAEPTARYFQDLSAIGFIQPGVVDVEKFERAFPGFLDTVKDLHRHVYGPAYWRRFLEQTSRMWLTLPSYSDDALASIPVPTLVVTGDRDEEPLAQAPRLCRTIPRAELGVIPGADHAAVERSLFRDVVLDFLARHSETTRPSTGARFLTQEQEQGDPS
jgi:pimeloyl-ACP methyl ester carboxylesterase